jgi:uncharacterized protein (UPF0332 family)
VTDSDLDVAAEMDLAHEALIAADILLAHDNTENSAVDRLYYACFHADRPLVLLHRYL